MIIDTHGADVDDEVLRLLGEVVRATGPVPIVIERDQNVPRLDSLFAEVERVRRIAARAASGASADDDASRRQVVE